MLVDGARNIAPGSSSIFCISSGQLLPTSDDTGQIPPESLNWRLSAAAGMALLRHWIPLASELCKIAESAWTGSEAHSRCMSTLRLDVVGDAIAVGTTLVLRDAPFTVGAPLSILVEGGERLSGQVLQFSGECVLVEIGGDTWWLDPVPAARKVGEFEVWLVGQRSRVEVPKARIGGTGGSALVCEVTVRAGASSDEVWNDTSRIQWPTRFTSSLSTDELQETGEQPLGDARRTFVGMPKGDVNAFRHYRHIAKAVDPRRGFAVLLRMMRLPGKA
jgi:hypothetical protein